MESDEKRVARRFYDIWSSGKLDTLEEVLAPNFTGHAGASASTVDEYRSTAAGFLNAFPDLKVEVRHLVQEGDLVSTWVTYTGTHQSDFAGVPASGRAIKCAGWDLMRLRDGKIVELTSFCDLFTILNSLTSAYQSMRDRSPLANRS